MPSLLSALLLQAYYIFIIFLLLFAGSFLLPKHDIITHMTTTAE